MATTASAASKPLERLRKDLPRVSHDELLELLVELIEEVASRVANYADAASDGAPVDTVNEGIAFAARTEDLIPTLSMDRRVAAASRLMLEGLRDLKAARVAS